MDTKTPENTNEQENNLYNIDNLDNIDSDIEEHEDSNQDDSQENSPINNLEKNNVIHLKVKPQIPYMIIGVVIFTVIFIAGYFFLNRTYKKYEIDQSYEREDETAMEYIPFQNGFIKYNVDGITYEDQKGNVIWTEAFTMTEPKVVMRGEYVALADAGNNQYMLYNTARKIGNFTTDYPITDIQLAEQGLVAVVLEDEKVNYIVAFDKEGEKCVEIKTTINKNGYPIAIALSEDGTKMVASYVTIEGVQVESSLTFYNFDNVGKNEVDRQVGYKKFDNELIPKIEFADNNTVCAFGDSRIVLYEMKQKPKEVLNKEVSKEIKSIIYNSKYVGYVYKNTKIATEEETSEVKKTTQETKSDETNGHYTLETYTLNGKPALTQNIDFNYKSIHSNEREIVVVGRECCKIYKYNGFVKYNGEYKQGINEFFPTKRRNHYIMITNKETQMIHLK